MIVTGKGKNFVGQMEKAQSGEKLHQRCKYPVFAVYISFGPYFLLNVCQIRMLTQIFGSRLTLARHTENTVADRGHIYYYFWGN